MTGMCDRPYVSPPPVERKLHVFQTLALIGAICLVICGLVWYAQSVPCTYNDALARATKAEARAEEAEKSLALMLAAGDGGVLVGELTGNDRAMVINTTRGSVLANINAKDLGPCQIRVVPAKK